MMKVYIFTDGACSGNPGRGGWCAILKAAGAEKTVSGSEELTTNNRMELSAVIGGLRALKRECEVEVYSDSKYICSAFNEGWLSTWRKNGWRKSDKKPVANRDLWEELDELVSKHTVSFHWIKGHAGHPENERCDSIAASLAAS